MASGWSAVIVNYNAGDALVGCVRSVLADDPEAGVVVVDNDSADDSLARLTAAFPEVPIVATGGNLGYARAANLGIAATRDPVVAVLNPDTEIHPGTAAALTRRFAAEPRLGAIGPQLRNPDGTVYPSARTIPSTLDAVGHGLAFFWWPGNPWSRAYRATGADPAVPRDVDWLSGAAIWLRRSALDEIGGWDERYFMYVEDVDLCWRLRRAGWGVAYEPGAVVTHHLGVSTAGAPYRMIAEHHRSLLTFARRRWTGGRRVLLPPAAAFLAFRAGLAMIHHRVAKPRPGTAGGSR